MLHQPTNQKNLSRRNDTFPSTRTYRQTHAQQLWCAIVGRRCHVVLASLSGRHQRALAAWQDHVPSHSAWDRDSHGDMLICSGQGLPYSCEHSSTGQGSVFGCHLRWFESVGGSWCDKACCLAFSTEMNFIFFVWTSVGQVRDVLMGPAAFRLLSPCIREQT